LLEDWVLSGTPLRQVPELLQREHTRLPAQSLSKVALHLRHWRVFGGTTGACSSAGAESWVIDYPLTAWSGRDRWQASISVDPLGTSKKKSPPRRTHRANRNSRDDLSRIFMVIT